MVNLDELKFDFALPPLHRHASDDASRSMPHCVAYDHFLMERDDLHVQVAPEMRTRVSVCKTHATFSVRHEHCARV